MAAALNSWEFGAEVCEALGLEKVRTLTIHIPLDGLVSVDAEVAGTEGLSNVDWAKLKENVQLYDHSWRDDFDERQQALISNCLIYSQTNPAGLPGHSLMLIIAKMAVLLSKLCGEWR